MENRRLQLHELLCEILESRNVYFQPPSSVKMNYRAIVYGLEDISNLHADNVVYLSNVAYMVTIIDPDPDSPIIGKVNALPKCRFVRSYKSDNLNHTVFKLYF